MTTDTKECLLLSGGLDSACAWWIAGKPTWFHGRGANYDSAKGESLALDRLKALEPEFAEKGVVDDGFQWGRWQRPAVETWYFPREYLLMFRAWREGYDHVMAAWVNEDFANSPVKREAKQALIEGSIRSFHPEFRFSFPIGELSKGGAVRAALEAGASEDFLLSSRSCVWHSNDKHCGGCDNCLDRWIALGANGIEDPSYIMEPLKEDLDALLKKKRFTCPDWVAAYRQRFNIPEGELVVV